MKHLHWLIIENEDNLNALLEDGDILREFVKGIFYYELDVSRKDGYNSDGSMHDDDEAG